MVLWLVLLNIVLSGINMAVGLETQSLFSIWVSGFCAASAFTIFLHWLFNRK